MLRSRSAGACFGSSLVRSGPNSLPVPLILWQETQVATWKSCLPLPNDRSVPSWAIDEARSSNVHSLRGRVDLSSSSAIGTGWAAR